MKLKKHLFICIHERVEGEESCGAKGSAELVSGLKTWVKSEKVEGAKVTRSGCLGLCSKGIAAVCYPEGRWYEGLKKEDLETLKSDLKSN
jgi:predicted metal-binding protein